MANYASYTPTSTIGRAMFNFDAMGMSNYRLSGTVRVSVSDSFSYLDYLSLGFNPNCYTYFNNEVNWFSIPNISEILSVYSQFANISFQGPTDYDSTSTSSSIATPAYVGALGLSDINITWVYRADVAWSGLCAGNTDSLLNYTGARGDVFLNSAAFSDFSLSLGTLARQTLEHEIGHALGLSHPHYGSYTSGVTTDFAATQYLGFSDLGFRRSSGNDMNKEYFTIMSYDDQISSMMGVPMHAHTPMIMDVIALQEAYGEGTGTHSTGNDTISAGIAGYRTYFDKGGIDTIDIGQYTTGAYLHMGVSITGASHLVGVSMSLSDFRALLNAGDPQHLRWFYGEYENATGSSGIDRIIGNTLSNSIQGGGGDDVISGQDGNDSIDGGNGNDTITGGAGNDRFDWNENERSGVDIFYGGAGDDSYVFNSVSDSAIEYSGEGTDTIWVRQNYSIANLPHIENLASFASTGVSLTGNSGSNSFYGHTGNDTVDGGPGSDTYVCGSPRARYGLSVSGSSWILDGTGNNQGIDTLTGVEIVQFSDQLVYLFNSPPILATPLGDATTQEDSTFAYTVSASAFSDAYEDALAYSARLASGDALPGWLSFNASTRNFSGIPSNSNVGTIDVTVTATDTSNASASDTFRITVTNVNDVPSLVNSIPDLTATEDTAFSFVVPSGTFVDIDAGDTQTYTASLSGGGSLPSWLSFDAASRTFIGIPSNDDVGSFDVAVAAKDAANTFASDTFRISVSNVNDAPVAGIVVSEYGPVTTTRFTLSIDNDAFTDADAGDTLFFSAHLANGAALPAWLSFDSATRTISGTPPAEAAGEIQAVQVTATDVSGSSASLSFVLTINDYNSSREIRGTSGAESLEGGAGNDTIEGGAGNDHLAGGGGLDRAVFSNGRSAYTFCLRADGSVEIDGADGTDRLAGIEQLQFGDGTVSLRAALPEPQLDCERHIAKVQTYFLGLLGRPATTEEASHFTAILRANQSRIWWYDASQTTTEGSLMSYLMAQGEYATLADGTYTQIVSSIFQRLTGQSAPDALIEHYVGRLNAGTLQAPGVTNKLLGELYLSPRGNGSLGTVADFADNRGYLDGVAYRGYLDNLNAIDGIDIANLDPDGNLVGLVGVT